MSRGRREAANQSGRQQRQRVDPFAEEIPYRQARRPQKKKKKKKSGGLAIGAAAAVVVLGAVLVWNFFLKKPDVSDNDRPGVSDSGPGGADDSSEGGGSTAPSGRKEDYYTFLLLGRDTAGGGNTDALILVSYDVINQQVNMMSIPRDTAVNAAWSTKKINSVYNAKESSGGGIQNLKQHVAYLTGVLPDFYVIIEWKAVGRVVDAVGGVEFDVPRNMNYDDSYQDLHIHLNKGVQKLNGQKAMEMLRYRHDNNPNVGYNDTGRMDTQKAFLKAMAKEVLKLKNMTKIGEFINIFMENVDTDLKLSDLTWFASKALGVDTENIQSFTMPYFDISKYRDAYYFLPDPAEIVPLVNAHFNPYNREITENDLRVLVRRDDGSCYVTGGGTLLDSSWGKSYSGKMHSTEGGGTSVEKPTGVTAPPASSSSGSSKKPSSQTATEKPAETPSGSSSGSGSSNNSSNADSSGSSGNAGNSGNSNISSGSNNSTNSGSSSNENAPSGGGTPAEQEPAEIVEPILPDPESGSQNEETSGEANPPIETAPADPEPVPEPEPELPPEPVLPPESILDTAAA